MRREHGKVDCAIFPKAGSEELGKRDGRILRVSGRATSGLPAFGRSISNRKDRSLAIVSTTCDPSVPRSPKVWTTHLGTTGLSFKQPRAGQRAVRQSSAELARIAVDRLLSIRHPPSFLMATGELLYVCVARASIR